jgi:hypothetical protein
MHKKNDLPSMPLYWGDIFKAPDIMALPKDIRDTWFLMLGRMWESKERGVLLLNGKIPTDTQLASLLLFGLDNQTCNLHVLHLLDSGVYSKREDGAIFCRRMVRDEEIRKIRQKCGSLGGNPELVYPKTKNKDNQTPNQIPEDENEDAIKDEIEYVNKEEKEIVMDFFSFRKSMRKPFKTKQGKEGFVKKLRSLGNNDLSVMKKIIDQSIASEYQGIFPLKENNGFKQNKPVPEYQKGTESKYDKFQ